MNDKIIEKTRYNNNAKLYLQNKKKTPSNQVPSYLDVSLKYYFSLFKKLKKNIKLLEIGAGMGENTKQLIDMGFKVYATDISPMSVKVMKKKFSNYKNFFSRTADMEKLPFKNETFDIICSAGSLSYGDNNLVMDEIYRVLKAHGTVVFLDSLNDNPIYRLNRYIKFLKNNRSKSTLRRIPDINLIGKYIKKFGFGKVKFFGSIIWTFPLLKIFLNEKLITKFLNWADQKLKVKKSAFKFVLILNKRK
jgi:ubiquinone/menaquinone biosynthesis C-methylase UbiE